ncbi:hypothetical protein TRVL_05682 [Trypanosoma vivax]|nr:hypothetical protein TRVL_05682 [Trypanosoma vivax]
MPHLAGGGDSRCGGQPYTHVPSIHLGVKSNRIKERFPFKENRPSLSQDLPVAVEELVAHGESVHCFLPLLTNCTVFCLTLFLLHFLAVNASNTSRSTLYSSPT